MSPRTLKKPNIRHSQAAMVMLLATLGHARAGSYQLQIHPEGAMVHEVGSDSGSLAISEKSTLVALDPSKDVAITEGTAKLLVIEKKGFIPVYLPLIHEPKTERTVIRIEMKKIDGVTKQFVLPLVQNLADELTDRILLVQQLLDKREDQAAVKIAEQLVLEHPNSHAVKMIFANTLVALGELKRADLIYEQVLSTLPEELMGFQQGLKQVRSRLNANPNRSPAKARKR